MFSGIMRPVRSRRFTPRPRAYALHIVTLPEEGDSLLVLGPLPASLEAILPTPGFEIEYSTHRSIYGSFRLVICFRTPNPHGPTELSAPGCFSDGHPSQSST